MSDPRIESWTASDGYLWKYRRFDPIGQTHGEIVALHGIQSQGGWYEASSRFLAENGWGVSFLDRRGSGLNQQARGDCPSFRRLLDDIAEFMWPLRQQSARPIVLQGISWGGKMAFALQKRAPGLCDGIILVAPGFHPKVRPSLPVRLGVLLNRFIQPTKLLPIPLNDPELFTANREQQRFIRDDPLSLHQATARFLFESRRLDLYVRRARRHVFVPTLLMLAMKDRIIDNSKTCRFVRRMRQVPNIEYVDGHHTLEFEDGATLQTYVGKLHQWLQTIRSST